MRARSTIRQVRLPVAGLDAISAISDMPADRAPILTNMLPYLGNISVRGGYDIWATGLGAPVESLIPWRGPTGSKFFGAAGGSIYEVTSSGAVGAAAVTGLTNNRWQHVHMATSGGNFVFLVNGVDAERHYNGTTWATPTLTNLTAGDAIQVMAHKRRIWMVVKNSTKAGYLPVDSISGTVSFFDFGPLFRAGGYLMAAASWTIDSGAGPDDFAVFVSSEGEAAVYQGIDPATAADWQLVGVYKIGRPIGRRCVVNYGPDLWIITYYGVVSMASVINTGEAQRDTEETTITHKLRNKWLENSFAHGSSFGWQAVIWNEAGIGLINVPTSENAEQKQFAINTITGAWGEFTGLNANCWITINGELYFGGNNGTVYQAFDSGAYDDDGSAITWEMATAFSDFGDPNIKHSKRVFVVISSTGSLSPAIGVDIDYALRTPTAEFSFTEVGNLFILGTSVLGGTDVLGGGEAVETQWIGVGEIGHAMSVHLKGQSLGMSAKISGLRLLYEQGGAL